MCKAMYEGAERLLARQLAVGDALQQLPRVDECGHEPRMPIDPWLHPGDPREIAANPVQPLRRLRKLNPSAVDKPGSVAGKVPVRDAAEAVRVGRRLASALEPARPALVLVEAG